MQLSWRTSCLKVRRRRRLKLPIWTNSRRNWGRGMVISKVGKRHSLTESESEVDEGERPSEEHEARITDKAQSINSADSNGDFSVSKRDFNFDSGGNVSNGGGLSDTGSLYSLLIDNPGTKQNEPP